MNHPRGRNKHDRKPEQSSNTENSKSEAHMETGTLQATTKQGHYAEDKAHDMELTDKKRNDLWTPHYGNSTQPDWANRDIHVQAHTNNDEPTLERRTVVPREEAALPKNTAANHRIMARQDSGNDNADANKGSEDNTSKTM